MLFNSVSKFKYIHINISTNLWYPVQFGSFGCGENWPWCGPSSIKSQLRTCGDIHGGWMEDYKTATMWHCWQFSSVFSWALIQELLVNCAVWHMSFRNSCNLVRRPSSIKATMMSNWWPVMMDNAFFSSSFVHDHHGKVWTSSISSGGFGGQVETKP